MDFGIVELISLLMGISGFSVGTNPKAPTPEASLQYAVPDADIVAHVDIGAIVPNNYKVLTNLANQPQIKTSPELEKLVRKMIAEVNGAVGIAKTVSGVDVTSDVSDATAFVQIVPHADPSFVLEVHGKFSSATIDRIAKAAGTTSIKVGAASWFDPGDGTVVAVTKDNVILAGTTALVKERIADTWKAPAIAANSSLAYAKQMLSQKPVFGVSVSMSSTARAEALTAISGQNFATDIIKRHKLMAFSVYRDGIGWSWVDTKKDGIDSMAQMSEGIVDILRAAQIAPRGFAKFMLGGLDSYRGMNKQVDDLIRHKNEIQKIVESYTGDGQFKSQIDKDPKTMSLNVRLTGKSLSEVFPLGGLIPIGAVTFLMETRAEVSPAPPVMTPAPPPVHPAPGGKKQGTTPKRP